MARPPLLLGTWGEINKPRAKNAAGTYTASARFRDYDGVTRTVTKTGATAAGAVRNLIEVLKDRSHLPGENLTRESTIHELAQHWLLEFEATDAAAGTKAAYHDALRLHILPAMQKVRLWEATVPYLDRFIKATRKSSGDAAAKRAKVVLSHMLGLATRHGAIAANPVRDVASVKSKKGVVATIGLEEVRLLRDRLAEWDAGEYVNGHPRYSDLADPVDVFLGTGLRTGELFALRKKENIDLAATPPQLKVSGTVVFATGEGYRIQEHPKTSASRRSLSLPPFAVEVLERRLAAGGSDLVFPSNTLTLRSPANFRRQWRDFRSAHNYPDWMTPKTFRKAVATLVANEISIERARDQLGHASVSVTEDHYSERAVLVADSSLVLQRFAS